MSASSTTSGARPRFAVSRVGESPRLQTALAAALYVVSILAITWPLGAHFGSQIFGQGGDAWAEIAVLRELVEHVQLPFLAGRLSDFNAPVGFDISYPLYIATWVSTAAKWVLMLVLGTAAGWNTYTLSGPVLTGVATFLLVRRLTANPVAAFVAGWAFGFWPFAIANAQGHPEFAHGWPFVLLLWRMLEIRGVPSLRNGVLAGLAAIVCVSFNPYFVLMGGVMMVTLAVADLLLALRDRDFWAHGKSVALAGTLPLVTLAAYGAINASAPASQLRSRSLSDLLTFTARPLEYLVRPPDSVVLRGRTQNWWDTHLNGSNLSEAGLYLGVTVVALAVVAVTFALLRRFPIARARHVWTLTAVGVVAAAFSAPPYASAAGHVVKLPSYYVFHLTGTWRVYSRFGMVVMLAAAMLLGLGLARLVEHRGRMATCSLLALAVLIVPLDLWTRPVNPTIGLPAPKIYSRIAREPRGIVAEYPILFNATPEYQFAINQRLYNRPLLNGFTSGTREEARALWLYDLADRQVPGALRLLGVTDVVLNQGGAPGGNPTPGPAGRGFGLVAQVDGMSLYRVTAPPARDFVWPAQGFSTVEGPAKHHFTWMTGSTGEIDALARCTDCRGRLRFQTSSFEQPRDLTVRDERGRVLTRVRVTKHARLVTVPVRFSRRARWLLSVTPGAQPAGADPRSLSIVMRDLSLTT